MKEALDELESWRKRFCPTAEIMTIIHDDKCVTEVFAAVASGDVAKATLHKMHILEAAREAIVDPQQYEHHPTDRGN